MAFVTGYFALFLQGSYRPNSSDFVNIAQVKYNFQKQVKPRIIINFNSLYYSDDHFKLLNPVYSLDGSGSNRSKLYSTSRDCFSNISTFFGSINTRKMLMWEEFRCKFRIPLPRNFFSLRPFMHPSGRSYAFLAFKTNKKPFKERKWLKSHLSYFHVTELQKIKRA